jgi:hypothetical protein
MSASFDLVLLLLEKPGSVPIHLFPDRLLAISGRVRTICTCVTRAVSPVSQRPARHPMIAFHLKLIPTRILLANILTRWMTPTAGHSWHSRDGAAISLQACQRHQAAPHPSTRCQRLRRSRGYLSMIPGYSVLTHHSSRAVGEHAFSCLLPSIHPFDNVCKQPIISIPWL